MVVLAHIRMVVAFGILAVAFVTVDKKEFAYLALAPDLGMAAFVS